MHVVRRRAEHQGEDVHRRAEAVQDVQDVRYRELCADRVIRLANSSATALLKTGTTPLVGRPIGEVAPELDALIGGETQDAIIQLASRHRIELFDAERPPLDEIFLSYYGEPAK